MYHTDEYLFELAGNNDNEALTTLMRRYQWRLGNLMRQKLVVKANEDDVIQIAWLRALTNKHKFDVKIGVFGDWFLTIARHAACTNNRTVLRDRKHIKYLPDDVTAEVIEKPEYMPEAIAMATDRANRVTGAIAVLAEDDQDIIRQFYFQEKTVTEIAADNRIDVEKVKSRLRQARKLMKSTLKGVV